MQNSKKMALGMGSMALLGSLLLAGSALAATPATSGAWGMRGGHAPGVFGTVASVNGTSLTVTSKAGPNGATAATYTVNASSATVTKNGTSSSVSGIAVGDTVMVQGTVNGTSVTATAIRDGMMGRKPGQERDPQQHATSTPIITGNGEPVVGGNVTAISGTTLTITNKSNVTYTVDASSATVEKAGAASSISNVAIGDSVVVQGTVSGSVVTASSVIDQGTTPPANSSTGTTAKGRPGMVGGFMGAIGGFFHNVFGFF